MVGLSVTTAIASFFVRAAAGLSAASLAHRSSAAAVNRNQRRRIPARSYVPNGAPPAKLDPRYADKVFLARQIAQHRDAIALYEDKAHGSDAQLRVFAQHILPHLQQHLTMLESLSTEQRHARR